MKRLILVILAIFVIAATSEAHKPHRGGGFNLFYSSLSPHGEWIEMSFGTVWRPHRVGHSWRPYLMGRWIWTDYGWYWSSYEPFGWATYHYGRWIYDDYYGWIWVPDDVWGPAWVEWRYDNDYIGWAPLPPYATFSINIGLSFGRHWAAPVHYWNFVPCGNFSSVHINNYVQPVDVSRRIFGRTRSGGHIRTVDRRIVNDGVGLDRVERVTRERIRKVEIVDRGNPGEDRIVSRNNRERIEVYRPGSEELRRESVTRDGRNNTASPEINRNAAPSVRERNAQRTPEESRNARTYQREPNAAERRAMEKQSNRAPERNTRRPDVDRGSQAPEQRREQLNRDRTQQSPQRQQIDRSRQQQQDRSREQIDRSRQQQDRSREQINRGQQNAGKQRPEVSRQRPDVSRERPSVRRDKPDGGGSSRSGQSGRRRPNG